MRRFFIRLLIFSLVLVLLAFLLDLVLPDHLILSAVSWLFIVFFVVTFAVHWIMLSILKYKPERFVSFFMLATVVKLVIYIIVILVYVFIKQEELLSFILAFFILYILYTGFEVYSILGHTKNAKQK